MVSVLQSEPFLTGALHVTDTFPESEFQPLPRYAIQNPPYLSRTEGYYLITADRCKTNGFESPTPETGGVARSTLS